MTKSCNQLENEISGLEITLNRMPLAPDNLFITVRMTNQITETERNNIMDKIALANPAYICHYNFINTLGEATILCNDLSERIMDIVSEGDYIKISYFAERVIE